jgi:nucleoside-diphosphate-sugar epimerase
MSQIKTVALVGASGNLGIGLLPLLRQHYGVTILSRVSSRAEFHEVEGLKVVRLKDDYPVDELTTAFHNIDAVICAVAPKSSSVQFNIIDAALAAGVKHYIPAEFGVDTTDPMKKQVLPALIPKIQVLEKLRSLDSDASLSWTAIATGLFFDWGLKIGFLRFDLVHQKAEILGDGNTKFSATTVADIAQAVVAVLQQYNTVYRNKFIFIQSLLTSQNEILETLQKLTGKQWDVKRISEQEFLERAKKTKEDGHADQERYDQILRLGTLYSNFESKAGFAAQLLEPKNVETEIAKVL